ncbi:MAG: hypothetical protein NC089_11410 [Bacteroides sp.]|nr:hypothetical protein [Bacteroides sp.]MCM1550440.1 hypothetical protein [Clostridium sp.]
MSDIRFSKEEYDTRLDSLNTLNESLNPIYSSEITQGEIVSESMDIFLELYSEILNIVRYYKWSMTHSIQSLRNAGEVLEQADQDASHLF